MSELIINNVIFSSVVFIYEVFQGISDSYLSIFLKRLSSPQ